MKVKPKTNIRTQLEILADTTEAVLADCSHPFIRQHPKMRGLHRDDEVTKPLYDGATGLKFEYTHQNKTYRVVISRAIK